MLNCTCSLPVRESVNIDTSQGYMQRSPILDSCMKFEEEESPSWESNSRCLFASSPITIYYTAIAPLPKALPYIFRTIQSFLDIRHAISVRLDSSSPPKQENYYTSACFLGFCKLAEKTIGRANIPCVSAVPIMYQLFKHKQQRGDAYKLLFRFRYELSSVSSIIS